MDEAFEYAWLLLKARQMTLPAYNTEHLQDVVRRLNLPVSFLSAKRGHRATEAMGEQTPEELEEATDNMLQHLASRGHAIFTGRAQAGSESGEDWGAEDSFMVPGLPLEDALEMGRLFHQDEIGHRDTEGMLQSYHTETGEPTAAFDEGMHLAEKEPDYYTGFPGSTQHAPPHHLEWRGWREP